MGFDNNKICVNYVWHQEGLACQGVKKMPPVTVASIFSKRLGKKIRFS